MDTITYELGALVPHSETTGVDFVRLEMSKYEHSPLALVWYTTAANPRERGARIDLQKQAFLDDFDDINRGSLNAEARLIVQFVHSCRIAETRAIIAHTEGASAW
jgi:hypothetical protein